MIKSIFVYLFQVIKQNKLNTPENPCNSSPDYVYNNCLERNLIKEVGCQPSWVDRIKVTNETSCNRKQIGKYLWRMLSLTYMGQKMVFLTYGCKRPCEYYEYKVGCSN